MKRYTDSYTKNIHISTERQTGIQYSKNKKYDKTRNQTDKKEEDVFYYNQKNKKKYQQ